MCAAMSNGAAVMVAFITVPCMGQPGAPGSVIVSYGFSGARADVRSFYLRVPGQEGRDRRLPGVLPMHVRVHHPVHSLQDVPDQGAT